LWLGQDPIGPEKKGKVFHNALNIFGSEIFGGIKQRFYTSMDIVEVQSTNLEPGV
jgi:hypothetical protein